MPPPQTAVAEESNGEWPEFPRVPPPIERLGDNPSRDELLKAVGTTLFAWGHVWPRAVQALEYLRHSVEDIKAWMVQHDEGLELLPPMRPRSESTHEQASTVGADVARAYEADSKNPSTPPMSPQTLNALIEQRVAIELEMVKQRENAAKWEAIEAERKASETDRLAHEAERVALARRAAEDADALAKETAAFRRKMRRRMLLGGLGLAFTTVGWLLEHFAK